MNCNNFSSWVSRLRVHPADLGLPRFHNHMSQFLKNQSLSLYIYASYGFSFSGELSSNAYPHLQMGKFRPRKSELFVQGYTVNK